jgi:hypothetical protein
LRAGIASGDLALELLLPRRNILQHKTNPVRAFSTVYQKSRWTFTAGYLRNELLDLRPRRGPFLP